MESFGKIIKKLRDDKQLPLRAVSAFMDIDQAILSKIERGHRKASREQVLKLAEFYKVDEEEFLVPWLSDKILEEVVDETVAMEVLEVVKNKMRKRKFKKTDKNKIIKQLRNEIKIDVNIEKVWIYGPFSKSDDMNKSEIDFAFQINPKCRNYSSEKLKAELEKIADRKVNIGFIDSFTPDFLNQIKPEMKLIYEKKAFD